MGSIFFCWLGKGKQTKFYATPNYLTDDVLVCKTNNHPVFGGVVLVFLLNDEAFSSIVICPTLCK